MKSGQTDVCGDEGIIMARFQDTISAQLQSSRSPSRSIFKTYLWPIVSSNWTESRQRSPREVSCVKVRRVVKAAEWKAECTQSEEAKK
jgi:hypothetical protein